MLIRSRAPLRLGLAGGGTDVSPYCDEFGGAILNATIDYYAYAGLEPLDNGKVEFVSADLHASTEYESQAVLETDGKLDLFKAVYNHVVRNFNRGKPLSLRMSTRVDVPAGSGLGSSSTLVVAMLAAYVEWLNVPLGDHGSWRILPTSSSAKRPAFRVASRISTRRPLAASTLWYSAPAVAYW